MYRDNETFIASGQTAVGSAQVNSTDVLDLRTTNLWGDGPSQELRIIVTTAMSAVGSVQFGIRASETEGSGYELIAQSALYVTAELTAGTVIRIPVPAIGNERSYDFLGGSMNTGTAATIQAGAVDMDFVPTGS